jgi:hypothetical protein
MVSMVDFVYLQNLEESIRMTFLRVVQSYYMVAKEGLTPPHAVEHPFHFA